MLAGQLGRLLCDGACQLPDGSRFVSADDWDVFLERGLDPAASGLRRVRRGFRVLALAEAPSKQRPWLTDEVLAAFQVAERCA